MDGGGGLPILNLVVGIGLDLFLVQEGAMSRAQIMNKHHFSFVLNNGVLSADGLFVKFSSWVELVFICSTATPKSCKLQCTPN